MSKRDYILRYQLIICKLCDNRKAIFDEINNHLKLQDELLGYNLNILKRTFQRDLTEIHWV